MQTRSKEPNPVDLAVGRRVRIRRLDLKVSQKKLAEGIGVTFQQVQKYEKGSNRISSSRLQQIADLLLVPVSFFFGTAGAATPDMGSLLELVDSAASLRLHKAFSAIEDQRVRRCFVELMEALAQR